MNLQPWSSLSEYLLRDYPEELNWDWVCQNVEIPEDKLREYSDKVQWWAISLAQSLGEKFIIEMKDKVRWNVIMGTQVICLDKRRRYQNEVNYGSC